MIRKKKGSVEWLEFELLADVPGLKHAVFLRHGGVSTGPFSSLNVGGGTNDNEEHIALNRAKIVEVLDCPNLLSSRQVHGKNVMVVPSTSPLLETGCDGMITFQKGVALMIKHADCQAALFYDPVTKAIGNVHAGWRGNVQNIYAETVSLLRKEKGAYPENLLVCISPSLGPCCAEFKNYQEELPASFLPFQVRPLYFDLWEVARMQLREAGVLESHIQIAKLCTSCEREDFFSYRRDKPTGRHATVIQLY